jgi:hypothetical protein
MNRTLHALNPNDQAAGAIPWLRPGGVVLCLALLLGWGLLRPGPARASAFVYLTDVEVSQISNGVRIDLHADGTVHFQQNAQFWGQFWGPEGALSTRRITFTIDACRPRVESFKSVALYPVDHLEFTIPQESQLSVTVALSVPAVWGVGGGSYVGITIASSVDSRGVVILVTSDESPEPKPVYKTAADAAGQQSLKVSAHEGLVDLSATNEPMTRVVQAVAEATGIRASVEESANRLVSAVVQDRRPEDLLALLCQAYGLDLLMSGPAFQLMGAGESDPGAGRVASIVLHHLDSEQARSLLPTFLLHYTHSDPGRNAVIISGSPAVCARVAQDLQTLDQPRKQCKIAVTFVTYSHTSDFVQTLDMARRTSNSNISLAAGSAGLPTGLAVYERESQASPGIDAFLNALHTNSDLKVDVRPSVQVFDGESASIYSGQDYYVVFNALGGGGGLEHIDIGTGLKVRPLIGDAGWITLQMSLDASDASSSVDHLPVVESRHVSDTIRLHSGDTLYIGGLQSTQHYDTRFRIPVLSAIPLIGNLFRGRQTHAEKQQIGVFVTAALVPEAPDADAALERSVQ